MRPARKVLVVEDDVDDLDSYAEVVEAGGFMVDKAVGLVEATAKVDRSTYAAMIVDISLRSPSGDDRDGLALLAYTNRLAEGTPVIMLTANQDTQLAADAIPKLGAFDYFAKTTIAKMGIQILVDAVRAAVAKNSLDLYRGAGDIVESLSGRSEAQLWADLFLRTFKPKGGFVGLRDFLDGLLKPALPLLAPVNVTADQRLALDEVNQLMRGVFWSKGFGVGVEVTVARESLPEGAGGLSRPALSEHRHSGLLGVVSARPDLVREDFA